MLWMQHAWWLLINYTSFCCVILASAHVVFTENQINLDIDNDEEDDDDSDDKTCNGSSVCSSLCTKDLKTHCCDVMKVKDY